MTGVVWFWPGVVVALIVATVVAAPVARLLGTRRAIAWLLVASLGVIVAATLTPIHGPTGIDVSELRICDLERRGPASWAELTTISDIGLNVALFIPFGFAAGVAPLDAPNARARHPGGRRPGRDRGASSTWCRPWLEGARAATSSTICAAWPSGSSSDRSSTWSPLGADPRPVPERSPRPLRRWYRASVPTCTAPDPYGPHSISSPVRPIGPAARP